MNFSIALSGLNQATHMMDAAAQAIVRATTPHRPAESIGAQVDLPLHIPEDAFAGVTSSPQPDLAAAMVAQITASAAFIANVQSLRRNDENMKLLLELK